MADPTFGFSINQEATEPRSVAGANMSVVGLVGTAPAADQAKYPVDTPVLIYSNDAQALTDLGATGTLVDAVTAINDQLGEFQTAAQIVIVRVAEGAGADQAAKDTATIANITAANRGIHALKAAATAHGVTPRLVAVPGYTHQRVGAAANAVCAALGAVLDSLLAVAVVEGPNDTDANDKAWRATIAHKRLIPITGGWKVMVGNVATAVPLAPRILGLAVKVDHENGGRPFRSWANRPILGGVGPARAIAFSLTDGAISGQDLLANQIGIVVRGEGGVDGAIADGGFVFVGTDNAGPDELWRQYHQVRGRDYVHLFFLRTLRFYLGRFNLTGNVLRTILDTVKYELRDREADGDILGSKVEFRADQNQPDQLRLGRIVIRTAFEEAPVLRHMTIQSARYRDALDDLLESLSGQASA
ncbi:phage tail sheath protein [Brevundimonas bacteroides]|uniref:hypothetical protein n=1 Tax=Brevundimonas bacteroides TaxID=74311 RepID=UPI0004962C01|nr:hypothetical protein [Brevundimonas bacteroides]